jgi:hypothetical protein
MVWADRESGRSLFWSFKAHLVQNNAVERA